MNRILVVARKEVKELLRVRSTLILGMVFSIVFAYTYSGYVVSGGIASLNGAAFYLSLSISLFMAYVSTSQVFLLEKREGVIETLICAPVSLRQIWAGKTMAGIVPAWIISVFSAIMLVVISGVQTGEYVIPDITVFVHLLISVPIFIAGFTGLVGFGQLLLGMRDNRILNFIIFMPAFAALYATGFAVAKSLDVTWTYVGIVLGASLLLVGLGAFLTRFLSRERIVTTIE